MFTPINIAHAAVDTTAFAGVIAPIVTTIVNPLIELAFAVAVVVFVWGVIQMIIHETDAQEHQKGKWSMLSGLIGIFIMASAWGIINIVANTVKSFGK